MLRFRPTKHLVGEFNEEMGVFGTNLHILIDR